MHSFWKSKTGKLFIGGCGTQLGMVFTFGGLLVLILACTVCVSSSALSIGLTQQAATAPTTEPTESALPPAELTLLRGEVDSLLVRVKDLRENVPTVPPPTPIPTPTPPTPMITASQAAINLRSGPGVNYTRIGRLPLGESLPIVGRNQDSSWWLVATPGGGVAWVSATVVAATYADDKIPVVSIPALLVQPGVAGVQPAQPVSSASGSAFPVVLPSTGSVTPTPALQVALPPGTPTAVASQGRRFVQDTLGYKQLIRRMLLPTVSESFSPHGDQIAVTERITLYTITPDGSTKRVLLEDDESIDLVGGAVWSPDGRYLAFAADQVQECGFCQTVGLVRVSDGTISYLEPPHHTLGLDQPRWTQDGRLLVNAHPGEPIQGIVHVYDVSGQGQIAAGSYVLSSSHDGQKWFPWQPGRLWEVSSAEGVDSYYSD
jgi:uncharacterized protein YgiM (DUF1202 family)